MIWTERKGNTKTNIECLGNEHKTNIGRKVTNEKSFTAALGPSTKSNMINDHTFTLGNEHDMSQAKISCTFRF